MTPSARIQSTLDLLEEITASIYAADSLVSTYFRKRRFIGSKDRGAISTRLYAILRHTARLKWWLEKNALPLNSRALVLAWLVLGEKMTIESMGALFSSKPYAPKALDDKERAFLKKIDGSTIEHPSMPEEVLAECPPALVEEFKQKFGKNFMREMHAMQEPAPLDLRINPLKTTREEILTALDQLSYKAEACKLSPQGVRVFARPNLSALPMLKNGLVEIQDEGSQLVASVVDAKPGERVVDFCAGAGGKTLALAASMKNKGHIMACDINEWRLKRSGERFRRAGVHNIEIQILKSEHDPWVKKHKSGFDAVLVDAPCSGSGTWRRNPDARWRPLGPGLEKLLKSQGDILESASRLVKKKGRLIYSTCSLLIEENEKQIEKFLAAHAEFTLQPCGLKDTTYLALTPYQHGTDGFFAALMIKS